MAMSTHSSSPGHNDGHGHTPLDEISDFQSPGPLMGTRKLKNTEFDALVDLLGTSDTEEREVPHDDMEDTFSITKFDVVDESITAGMTIGENTPYPPDSLSPNGGAGNAFEQHIIEPLPLRRLQALRGDPMDDVSRASTGFRPLSPRLVGADVSSSPISPLQLPAAKPVRPISALQISAGEYSAADTSFQSVESHSMSMLDLNTGGAEPIRSNDAVTKEPNTRPLPVEQLDFALSQANLRLSDVRSKLDDLVPLVKESVPQEFHGSLSSLGANPDIFSDVPPSHGANAPSTMSHSYDTALQSLTEMSKEKLQSSLASLLSSLSLPATALDELDQPNATRHASFPSALQSVSDIHRAVSFVSKVDELVWRRSSHTPPHVDPFGEENVRALVERVELWEKAVRIRR